MNIIILLAICLVVAILAILLGLNRQRREECHNARVPKEEEGEKSAEPGDVEAEGKSSNGPVKDAGPVVVESTAPAAMVPDAIPEVEIIEKMQAGLTRDQAVEVITHQRAHDKALAAQG